MSRNNLPSKLLDRELGHDYDFSNLNEQPWSFSVIYKQIGQDIQFSNTSKIFSIQFRENFLVVLTKTSECYIWNTLNPTVWQRILSSNYKVLKVTILDNNSFFLVSKRNFSERLEFFKFQVPVESGQTVQMLVDLNITLENLKECDVYSNKLVVCVNGSYKVFDIISMNLLFQSSETHWYSRNHVALVRTMSTRSEVSFHNLNTGAELVFVVNNRFRVELIETFRNFFVFSNNNTLCYGDFSSGESGIICQQPTEYFVGLNMSAAVFENYMVLINSRWTRVDLVPSVFCADLVGIFIIYEKFNMHLVVLNDDGIVLRTVPLDKKIMYISVNQETYELAVACKNIVSIFV